MFRGQRYDDYLNNASISAGKSIFIGLQGGLLLGDPVFYALAGALLEGYAEGAVAAVATAVGQECFPFCCALIWRSQYLIPC